MAISFVGSAKGTNTATAPAHAVGDLMLVVATRNASATAPTLPSGFVNIGTNTANTYSIRAGYKICTSTSDATGTWTNATECICTIFRPTSGKIAAIGNFAFAAGSSVTVSYTGFTQVDTSGSSWVARFGGTKTASVGVNGAMTSFTQRQDEVGTGELVSFDTNAGVASNSTATQTITSSAWKTFSVEIVDQSLGTQLTNIYQHVAGGGNPTTRGNTSNTFKIPLTNITGAGNCLVLAITYDGGATVSSVSDNINSTWGAASISCSPGAGSLDSKLYIFPNITSGTTTITVTFSANVTSFQYCVTELYNIDSSPSAGTTSRSNSATQNAGAFTPTNNNGTGGNFIWAYFCKSIQTPAGTTTNTFAGASFTKMSSDTGWNNANDSIPKIVEGFVQTTAASITPAFTSVNDTADTWNSMAIALKINTGQGIAPNATNIRAGAIHHFATLHFPASGMYVLEAPCIGGNLLAIMSTDPNIASQTVSDNLGNTWTLATTGNFTWYLANQSVVNTNLKIFLNGGGTDPTLSFRFVEIWNADPSPLINFQSSTQTLNGLSSFTASPSPNPTSAPGLMIANIELGQGPGLGVSAPSGAVWSLCTYTGETDLDLIENADILAFYRFTVTGAQTWTISITNQAANSSDAGFVSFKEAAVAAANPFVVFDLNAGLIYRSLPRLNRGHFAASQIQLIGQDQVPGGGEPGQVPDYDYPPWLAPRAAITLRTHFDPTKIQLIGQDQVYGPSGQVPFYELPNPTPRKADNNLNRTWLYDIIRSTLSLITFPFVQTEWPNPIRALFRMQDHSARTSMAGQDQLYGAAGEVPTYDYNTNPIRRKDDIGQRTWVYDIIRTTLSIVIFPFALFDWPNPRGPKSDGNVNRTHLDQTKQQLIGLDVFYGGAGEVPTYEHSVANPVRRKPDFSLRTWLLNIIQILTAIFPQPTFNADFPNPLAFIGRLKAWGRVAGDAQQLGYMRPLLKVAQPPAIPPVPHNTQRQSFDSWITQIARNSNLHLSGKMNATARVVLNPGQDSTVLNDSRIGPFSHITLTPLSASAADVLASGLIWFEPSQGSVTIHHPVMGYFDAVCSALIIG